MSARVAAGARGTGAKAVEAVSQADKLMVAGVPLTSAKKPADEMLEVAGAPSAAESAGAGAPKARLGDD